jgi:hypothetical protein
MEQPRAALRRLDRDQHQRSGGYDQSEIAERRLVAQNQIDDHQHDDSRREQQFGQEMAEACEIVEVHR